MAATRILLLVTLASTIGLDATTCSVGTVPGANLLQTVQVDLDGPSPGYLTAGDTATFTAQAENGTPPYTYLWYVDYCNKWIDSGSTFTTDELSGGYHDVYVRVRDILNRDSEEHSITFYVYPTDGEGPDPSLGPCSSLAGTYDFGTWGTMTFVRTGASFTGSYTHRNGTITNATLDDDVLRGTWTEYYDDGSVIATGTFEFTFAGDWKSFDGVWRYANSPYWNGNWYGSRTECD